MRRWQVWRCPGGQSHCRKAGSRGWRRWFGSSGSLCSRTDRAWQGIVETRRATAAHWSGYRHERVIAARTCWRNTPTAKSGDGALAPGTAGGSRPPLGDLYPPCRANPRSWVAAGHGAEGVDLPHPESDGRCVCLDWSCRANHAVVAGRRVRLCACA